MTDTKVAIACQGGGTHTAFSAGFLAEAVPELDRHGYELVGLSGTSGGAFAAAAAWYGSLAEDVDVADPVEGIWEEFDAETPTDRLLNDWLVGGVATQIAGVPSPQFSPYQVPLSEYGMDRIRDALATHVDFDAIPELAADSAAPHLVVGAVNVTDGTFERFTAADVTVDAVAASAAVPRLYEAVEIGEDAYWDGLYSQNPPVVDLLDVDPADKPEELWIVQVNPQRQREVPRSLVEIEDRRGELAANVSINQELRYVERVNEWIDRGFLPESEFERVDVHRVILGEDYGTASKVDRDPEFIDDLLARGRERAREFLG